MATSRRTSSTQASKKTTVSKGLTPTIFKGLNDKRMAKGTGGNRLIIKQGDTVPVQFLDTLADMREYELHTFQDGNRWNFVPCAGKGCPLCEDENSDVSRTRYRFCANVYSLKEKQVKVINGPKDLANRVATRYKRKPELFLKRVWDVSMFPTQPVSYDVELAEEFRAVQTRTLKKFDLDKYIEDEMQRFFGADTPTGDSKGRTAMDDDDDDDAEDDEYEEDELLDMPWIRLKRVATEMRIKLVTPDGDKRKRDALVRLIMKRQAQ